MPTSGKKTASSPGGLAKNGPGRVSVPGLAPAYGGLGGDFLYSVIVTEELSHTAQTGLAAGLHSDVVVPYIDAYGSEAVKRRYLPGCVSGDCVTAVAMTEPDPGSDLAGMQTTAVEEGDSVVLNGSKTFISNGINRDLVVVAARNPAIENAYEGMSLYLVEAGTPGFNRGRQLEKMGWRSQDTAELFFTNCRIPLENRLGEKGMGFLMLMEKLQQERLMRRGGRGRGRTHPGVDHGLLPQNDRGGRPMSNPRPCGSLWWRWPPRSSSAAPSSTNWWPITSRKRTSSWRPPWPSTGPRRWSTGWPTAP